MGSNWSGGACPDADGVLQVGNVESDILVEVTASYGGLDAEHPISVAMISTQMIYPLSGFEGKVVVAKVYDPETGDYRSDGPREAPDELVLEDLGTNQWYWITISESNTMSGAWNKAHVSWLHL
ncbi:MAG: hypothetical protein V5783_09725 [Pontiella sp.]